MEHLTRFFREFLKALRSLLPVIAAIGIGPAGSIRGRSALSDGFGLVALCVMVPTTGVQLYGIWVPTFCSGAAGCRR